MDIPSRVIRDRRGAAANEHVSVAGLSIYGRGSGARAGGAAGARPDRLPHQIHTIVLHQTAGSFIQGAEVTSDDSLQRSRHRIDRIASHFIVTDDGQAIYLRDVGFVLNNAGGRFGIDIEFCGSFSNTPLPRGRRLSEAAILCGRELLQDLARAIPSLRQIHPHGQIQAVPPGRDTGPGSKYDSCSGPEVWVNVGEWAVQSMGLVSDPPAAPYHNHGISPRQSNQAYRRPGL